MTHAIVDASVVVKWFRSRNERHVAQALALRKDFQNGTISLLAPSLLFLEILNVAGRRWRLTRKPLSEMASDLTTLGLEIRDPKLEDIAEWTSRGLTAYDASYVALAETEAARLVTDDEFLLRIAPELTLPLASVDIA